MELLRIYEIRCEGCDKHLVTKHIKIMDIAKYEKKSYFCKDCDKILSYGVSKI